jgi:hypothetical protein
LGNFPYTAVLIKVTDRVEVADRSATMPLPDLGEVVSENILIGSFFRDDINKWMGEVVGQITETIFLVEYGLNADNRKLVDLQNMTSWVFYKDRESLIFAYEYLGIKNKWAAEITKELL